MIKHNLKLILRSLWRKRIYSLIILLSLTVGFVCTNILISFLVYESNTDTFHTNRERTFQVLSSNPFGDEGLVAYIPDYFLEYLTNNYPEVENACQISSLDSITIKTTKDSFNDVLVLSVDSSFFTMFDFPLLKGRRDKSVTSGKIVLTTEKALTLFGSTDVIGKVLTMGKPGFATELIISAVVDRPIENSHLHFDALVHHSTLRNIQNKKWNGGATYVLLTSSDARAPLLNKVRNDAKRPGLIGPGKVDYFLNPLTDSYFNTDNKMEYMKTRDPFFLAVGYITCCLVFFIASFNFINLFLLSWENRKKEIGIKKTLGVSRRDLLGLSITEAALYIVTGFLLSLIITYCTIPIFNTVFEASLTPGYLLNAKVIASICVVLFFTACFVVILSVTKQWRMKPIRLMADVSSKVRFNRLLFTIQFVISITLAICSVTIMQQMTYIKDAPLGFNRQILQLTASDRQLSQSLPVLKQRIIQLPGVKTVTVGTGNPIFGNMIVRYNLDGEQFYTPYVFGGDEDYLKALDITLIEGELPSETVSGKLVNQTLVRQFNLKKPIGEKIPGTNDVIAGVVKDFTCGSFKQEIPPVIISFQKEGQALLIDYRGGDLSKILPQIQAEWESVFPDYLFTYEIIQEELMKVYKEDTFFYKIIITFSIISMILSCFGLFALSWAVVQSRIKEMGIRKVLGATHLDIWNLLTWTFTKRIALAFTIAAPIGYYLMNEWLTRFVNRIELNLGIFCISGFLVTLVAFMTLSLQTMKATMTNPVDEIRSE